MEGRLECGVVCAVQLRPHQQALDDGVSVLAFVVHHLDVVQVGVGPVHQPADQVQRDAVWEHDLTVHQLGAVLTVHVTALHLGDLTVVGEEHLPEDTWGSDLSKDGWFDPFVTTERPPWHKETSIIQLFRKLKEKGEKNLQTASKIYVISFKKKCGSFA